MTDETAIAERPKILSLGALPTTGPIALIQQASSIASELANIIKSKNLSSRIQGREFVHVEGWSTMGAMLGVLPREIPGMTQRLEDGSYLAYVELIRINDGAVIGSGSALCGMDEKDSRGKLTWANRPEYARRSMAITRATGKAYRLGFSWIMALAGYEPTPAEEIIEGDFEVQKPPTQKPPSPTPPAANGKAAPPPQPHWIKDPKVRARFWAWTQNDLSLANAEVYEALNCQHVEEFAGTMEQAKACILAWVAAKAALETEAIDG